MREVISCATNQGLTVYQRGAWRVSKDGKLMVQ